MAMMLVDGVELPTPSSFEWSLIDVSASDSGRTQDGKMHKNRISIFFIWNRIMIKDKNVFWK